MYRHPGMAILLGTGTRVPGTCRIPNLEKKSFGGKQYRPETVPAGKIYEPTCTSCTCKIWYPGTVFYLHYVPIRYLQPLCIETVLFHPGRYPTYYPNTRYLGNWREFLSRYPGISTNEYKSDLLLTLLINTRYLGL